MPMEQKEMAMFYDIERCSGCRACMVACKQWHELPADFSTTFEGEFQSHADFTPSTYTVVRFQERTDKEGEFHWDIWKTQCMHCQDPACLKGCPEDAIVRRETGAVVIDHDKCVGCGYCRTNCPWDVPRIDPQTNKSHKCDFCFDRMENGMEPSCSKTCTAQALVWGPIHKMRELAHKRLDEMKEKYPDANLYGVEPNGVGGTHMMYLLPEKPSVYGFPEDPKTPASVDLYKHVVKPAGQAVVAAAAVGVAGLWGLTSLIKKRADENAKKGDA